MCAQKCGELAASAVRAHADVVQYALDPSLTMTKWLLLEAAEIDLVIRELPAGERLLVGTVRLQVRCMGDPVPEPRPALRTDQHRHRVGIELGIEEGLQV